MKRLAAVAGAVVILTATACGNGGVNVAEDAPSVPAYRTNENVAAPSGSDLHECKTRMVNTKDGDMGLKKRLIQRRRYRFLFHPRNVGLRILQPKSNVRSWRGLRNYP